MLGDSSMLSQQESVLDLTEQLALVDMHLLLL